MADYLVDFALELLEETAKGGYATKLMPQIGKDRAGDQYECARYEPPAFKWGFVAGYVKVSGSKQGDQHHENRVIARLGDVYETVQMLPLGKECFEAPVRCGAVRIAVACLVHGHQLPSRRHASLVRIYPLPYHFGTPYRWGSDGGAE